MFPHFDEEILRSVYQSNASDIDATTTALLEFSAN